LQVEIAALEKLFIAFQTAIMHVKEWLGKAEGNNQMSDAQKDQFRVSFNTV